ncbi:MAG: 50S ribosomal protein L28 [Candidatus Omnitrophota bacterium]
MLKDCFICGKGPMVGNKIVRRGMAKKKGGAGRKVIGISKRLFLPNVQRINIILDGTKTKAYVCTKCIKAGKVQKA